MSRVLALLIALFAGGLIATLIERLTSAPVEVGAGLAGVFGVGFYDLLRRQRADVC